MQVTTSTQQVNHLLISLGINSREWKWVLGLWMNQNKNKGFHSFLITKQKREIEPMLVFDAGPTLNQHWFNISWLLEIDKTNLYTDYLNLLNTKHNHDHIICFVSRLNHSYWGKKWVFQCQDMQMFGLKWHDWFKYGNHSEFLKLSQWLIP